MDNERVRHNGESERYPGQSVFEFDVVQPDGTPLHIDMSAMGELGDFAFAAIESGRVQRFYAYWTNETSIFVDVLKRLSARQIEQVTEDVEQIKSALEQLERTGEFSPSTRGQGEMSGWTVDWLMTRNDEPHDYQMFSGGDDAMSVDGSHDDGLHLATNRRTDNGWAYREITIPEADIWRFAAGMIARSYQALHQSTPLTRYPTEEYLQTLERCLALTS